MASHHHHHQRIGETSYISESTPTGPIPSSSSCSGHIDGSSMIPYAMLQGMNNPITATTPAVSPYMYHNHNQTGPSLFDFEELERAIIVNQGNQKFGYQNHNHHQHDDTKSPAGAAALYTTATAASSANGEGRLATTNTTTATTTLEMFPSWPIKFQQQQQHHNRGSSNSVGGVETTTDDDDDEDEDDSGSAVNNTLSSSKVGDHHHPESPISSNNHQNQTVISQNHQQLLLQSGGELMMMTGHISRTSAEGSNHHNLQSPKHQLQRAGSGSSSRSEKPLDAKTLRRLAQNREAAKKSRLRKKAYVQQLESSRIKLAQLEQDLQRARSQGLFLGGAGGAPSNISSGAAIFDMEYARWLDDDHRHMTELRTGLQAHLSDGDLHLLVDRCINHHDEIFRLKGAAAKSDVFHLITGMWTTPAERCFLWMGGFRPSEIIKMLRAQLDPLTEQQMMGIHSLQESSQQAEEALTQGLEQLQQSLVDTVAGSTVMDGMQQMAVALGKLSSLEGFVRQADNLRQQTLHQLCRILTVRQAARCFLMIGEYYGRLRALSSLWSSRPRESMVGDDNANCQAAIEWQMMQHQHQQSQGHFPAF